MAAKKRELTAPQQMWVDALTSGKYRWATDSLQSDDGKRQLLSWRGVCGGRAAGRSRQAH